MRNDGIMQKLVKLPNFDDYDSEETYKNTKLQFFYRPAIPWKISCEPYHPRTEIHKLMKNAHA